MGNFKYVRFLLDLPAFMGSDRLTYGPYKSGDVGDIPVLNANVLLRRNICYVHDPLLFFSNGFKKPDKYVGLTDSECALREYWDLSKSDLKFVGNLQLGLDTVSGLDSIADSRKNNEIWVLPGQGLAGYDCNTVKFGLKCSVCGDKKVIYMHCDKPECPTCRDDYAYEHGRDVVDRLNGCNDAYFNSGIQLGYFKHWVISPPQIDAVRSCETHKGYTALRSAVTKLLLDSGIQGGSLVFHYYRIKKELLSDLRSKGYGVGKGGNGSLWEGVLLNCLVLGSSYDYVYPSPHFHVLGVGHAMHTDNFKRFAPGWILSMVSKVGDKTFTSREKHMKNITRYQLSHVSRLRLDPEARYNTLAVTYFGLFSNNKVKVDEIYSVVEGVECEKCSGSMHLCGFFEYEPELYGTPEGIDWDYDLGEYLQKRKIKKYVLVNVKLLKEIMNM